MDFINTLRDMNAWWLPILVFLFFSIIGIVFGAINGWKSSLYWFIINLVGAGIAMGVTMAIWSKIEGHIRDALKNQSINISNFDITKGAAILSSMFGVTFLLNLIGLIVYIFLRKKLKRSIRNNRSSGKSNLNSRIIGAGLGLFSVLPTSLLFTTIGTVASSNKNVNKMFSGLTKLSTYGLVDNISEDYEGLYAITSSVRALEELANVFTGENINDINTKKIKDSSEQINILFVNKKTLPLINEIIENQDGIKKGEKLDQAKLTNIKNNAKLSGLLSFLLSDAKENAKKLINDHFKKDGETADIAKDLIEFLTTK